jgi:hypothetical protein
MTSAISTRTAAQLQVPDVHVSDYLANLATAKAELSALQAIGNGYVVAADAAASTTTAETAFARVPAAGTVTAIKISPTGAVTASDTLYATITIKWRDGAGGAASTLATLITNVAGGSWVAFTTKDMGAITNAAVPAGGVLTYTVAKASTGTQLPSYVIAPVFG